MQTEMKSKWELQYSYQTKYSLKQLLQRKTRKLYNDKKINTRRVLHSSTYIHLMQEHPNT